MIDLSRFHPLRDQVLLERIEDPNSLLAIPDIAQRPARRGRVLRTGPGRRISPGFCLPLEVKPGDVVQYQSSDVDTGTHILIQEADILFIEQ